MLIVTIVTGFGTASSTFGSYSQFRQGIVEILMYTIQYA
ncbi:hypothetical protein TPY_2444 [Sulfobacillus acidophilus TPY]|nr:hypothetical protein TPY_2444 [Sulfobacillus acidophilus TPY]